MGSMDKTDVRRFYEEQLRYFGPNSAQALAWRSEKSQLERFEILAQVGNLNSCSVLDEGCGLGDLYPFLAVRFSDISYTGVDISPELIKEAEKKYGKNYAGSNPVFQSSDFSEYGGGPLTMCFRRARSPLRYRIIRRCTSAISKRCFS